MKAKLSTTLFFLFIGILSLEAQEKTTPPPLQMTRAEENFSYLKNAQSSPYKKVFGDELKYVSLNPEKSIYFTFGASYRTRFESTTNQNWTNQDDSYYSQRISFHSNLQVGSYLRFFGELYHGYTTSENRVLEDETLDLHQGFIELIPIKENTSSLSVRLGRQEMGFGVSRLFGIREGPNMRRTFDLGRVIYTYKNASFNAFYGKEVSTDFNTFDNSSNIFKGDNIGNPELWGIYTQGPSFLKGGTYDLYYLGFQSKLSTFNDVTGKETRHTLGIRSSGNISSKFTYNTELIYQFGKLGSSEIRAFNIETDWTYKITTKSWKPTLGLKLDWSSGDAETGDGKIQTFSPLFVNPAIYSLAAVNTPANLTSFHPNITLYPLTALSINIDYALFYRTKSSDGLYTPPRFLTRPPDGIKERHIGDTIGLQVQYQINRNISFNLRSSYFIAGKFIQASGSSENTFYVSPTITFKF